MIKNATLLLALASAAYAGKVAIYDEQYTFETYLADFRLSFPEKELPMRKELFTKELRRVIAHNSQKNVSWREGLNQFSALTNQEKMKFYGRNKNMANKQKGTLKSETSLPADFKLRPVSELPTNVDWREKGKRKSIYLVIAKYLNSY